MQRLLSVLLTALALVALHSFASAQNMSNVQIYRTSTNVSSTIAVTNTFQSVIPAPSAAFPPTNSRVACTVQNTGTNPMYVFFGPIASATIAKSVVLTTGQAVTCNNDLVSLQDQVSITGTATETFFAAYQ